MYVFGNSVWIQNINEIYTHYNFLNVSNFI